MFKLFSRRKEYPIKKLVQKTFGDELIIKNFNEGNIYINASFITLTAAFMDMDMWNDDKFLRDYKKIINEDILAFEISIFDICQVANILKKMQDEDDELPKLSQTILADIRKTTRFIGALYEKYYEGSAEYYENRILAYSEDSKSANLSFSFNLTNIKGAQDFIGLKGKVRLDLKEQMEFIAYVGAHRSATLHGLMESLNRVYEGPGYLNAK